MNLNRNIDNTRKRPGSFLESSVEGSTSSPRKKKSNTSANLKRSNSGGSRHLSTPLLSRLASNTVSLKLDPGQVLKNKPSFDCQFVSTDQDVLNIVDAITEADKSADVILMTDPNGLDRDNLTRRLTVLETGGHCLVEGRLFQDQPPLTLVLDIRNMSASELTDFNDLLDPENPCLYNKKTKTKKKLGSHVSILVLAAFRQLSETGSADSQAPGVDFWRRVNRSDNTWKLEKQASDGEPMVTDLCHCLPEYSSSSFPVVSTVTVDLHIYPDWRSQLFGWTGVNSSGRICHIPGILEQLKDGQGVILKGANWQDLEFQQQIRQLQHGKRYYSNGKSCTLPDAIQFFRADVSEEEVRELCLSSMTLVTSPPEKPVVINQSNLSQWLNPITINDEGLSVLNTSLPKQLNAGATLAITS